MDTKRPANSIRQIPLASYDIPSTYRPRKCIVCLTVSILSRVRSVHAFQFNFFKINFHIIPPPTSRPSKCPIPLIFFLLHRLCLTLSQMGYMLLPRYPLDFITIAIGASKQPKIW